MPYIEQEVRDDLNGVGLENVCHRIEHVYNHPGNAAGAAAFAIYRILKALAGQRRFWSVALAGGVALFAVLEFYRRVVAPYEDLKCDQNGDVQ
jgi:hypothetical protein